MKCQNILEVQKYLSRFDEILCQMTRKMLSTNIVDNITINFIVCMIPHHQAAIYMCENLLKYTDYEPLQEIAKGIIEMQTRGIEQMKEILRTTSGYENSPKDVNCYMAKYYSITKNMISRMQNSPRCMNINLNFVGEMIPHHEGAIAMCKNLLQYCIDPRLKDVADSIIREQSEGVRQLEEVQRNICKN